MTERELAITIRINQFDLVVLQDIIRAVKYFNRMLKYDEINKEYLINPWFEIGIKEYQF